jgi:hypothetical protein
VYGSGWLHPWLRHWASAIRYALAWCRPRHLKINGPLFTPTLRSGLFATLHFPCICLAIIVTAIALEWCQGPAPSASLPNPAENLVHVVLPEAAAFIQPNTPAKVRTVKCNPGTAAPQRNGLPVPRVPARTVP